MKEKENLLKNTSISTINRWINSEQNPQKKELFRCYKSDKMKSTQPKMAEVIKVIDENLLDFEGFKQYSSSITNNIEAGAFKLERSYAEFDNRYRQIVCNAIIVSIGPADTRMYGFLERKRCYTEKALVGTLGMAGGHLNENDATLYSGLIREVSEEIRGISFETSNISPIGYIREVSDTISNYHICSLYLIKIPYSNMNKLRSQEKQEKLLWMSEDRVKVELEKSSDESIFDSWCKLGLESILLPV